MTVSAEVPAVYRTRWNSNNAQAVTSPGLGVHDHPSRSGDAPDSTPRKLNASCVNCRKSRVKCTGGSPCDRCAVSSHSLYCEYGVSRRRGKRKASDGDSNALRPTQTSTGHAITSDNESGFNESVPLGLNVQDGPRDAWRGFGLSGNDVGPFGQPVTMAPDHVDLGWSPSLTDFLNTLESPEPPPGPTREDSGTCSNGCFISVHAVTNKLASSRNATGPSRFDRMMSLFDESIVHATKYLACMACDAGCPRLMTLSLLHQRQIDSLADLTKNPGLCFSDESPRVTFGEYAPPAEDDINCKSVVLLRVARDIAQSLDSFHDGAKDFEERYFKGTLELGEAGKLNLKWLLGVAVTLKRRVDCVRMILQKPDWAVHV